MNMTLSYYQAHDRAVTHQEDFIPDLLISLIEDLPIPKQPQRHPGRPPAYPLQSLLVLLVLMVFWGMSYRRFAAHIAHNHKLLARLGIPRAPHYSVLNRAMDRLDPALLQDLIRRLADTLPAPREVAFDATGISHTTGGEWFSIRLQKRRRRRFHGLHIAVDTDTLLITAAMVRRKPGGEASTMLLLLAQMPTDRLEAVYGDKAYISRANVTLIDGLGARAVIEPKRRLSTLVKSHRAYAELVRKYYADPEGWREKNRYGTRSLVESVFSTLKRRFGGSLRSRLDSRRTVEVLLKVVTYNADRLSYLACCPL